MFNAKGSRKVVGRIVNSLKNNKPKGTIKIDEVFKGGSLGQGTAISVSETDIDLVLYSRSISKEDLKDPEKYKILLSKLEEHLKKILSQRPHSDLRVTPPCIQFTVYRSGRPIEVDLVPSCWWDSPKQYIDFIFTVPPEQRSRLFGCSSKWQTEFVKHQEGRVKELIRRMKKWRNTNFEASCKPISYLISLLVIKAYERVGIFGITAKSSSSKKRRVARKVKEELKHMIINHRTLDVCWSDRFYGHEIEKIPRVIDPCNPAANYYYRGMNARVSIEEAWEILASKIDSLDLTIPLT